MGFVGKHGDLNMVMTPKALDLSALPDMLSEN